MTSSREENPGPASSWTVTPREVVRIGREALRPFTGLMKHQAGTAPISTSPGLTSESRPTIHQPSSNDWTTFTFSPSESTSSSGSTGANSWRTLRPSMPRIVDAVLYVDALDTGRLFPKLKKELRRGEASAALRKETVEMGRAPAAPGEEGASVLLTALENGRVMVPVGMW